MAADKKGPVVTQGENPNIAVTATAHLDREAVKQLLGTDFGGSVVVVEVTLTPKTKDMKVFADDFLLRSYKDGQKSNPFAPTQLAGKGAVIVKAGSGGGGIMAQESGPIWGGLGGGRPGRMGGSGGGIGNSGGPESVVATVTDGAKEKENPVLQTLKDKALPEKETSEPVKGLLYFPLEGKHKAKELTLVYSGQGGKLTMEFHQ